MGDWQWKKEEAGKKGERKGHRQGMARWREREGGNERGKGVKEGRRRNNGEGREAKIEKGEKEW